MYMHIKKGPGHSTVHQPDQRQQLTVSGAVSEGERKMGRTHGASGPEIRAIGTGVVRKSVTKKLTNVYMLRHPLNINCGNIKRQTTV